MVLYGRVSLMKSEETPSFDIQYKKISGTSGAKTLPQISATRLRCKIITLLLYYGSAKTVAQEQTQHAGSLANGRTKKEHTS